MRKAVYGYLAAALALMMLVVVAMVDPSPPRISLTPDGRHTGSLGYVWFVLAVTNNTDRMAGLHISCTQIVTLPSGDVVTNSRGINPVTLFPKAGTRVDFPPPEPVAPWTVHASYLAPPSGLDAWARSVGARLGLCRKFVEVWREESVRISE